jgi:hypothetical protein
MASAPVLITDYLKAGTAAARPAAPTPPSGGLVIYIATDTLTVSVWDGSAWRQGSYADGSGNNPDWTSGAGAPAATKPVGSLYSRTGGALGSRLYVSAGGGVWNAVAGV